MTTRVKEQESIQFEPFFQGPVNKQEKNFEILVISSLSLLKFMFATMEME